jgi:hypothetical protein
MRAGKVSAACKAEIERRAQKECVHNSIMQGTFGQAKQDQAKGMTIEEMCAYRAFSDIGNVFAYAEQRKKQEDEEKKKQEQRKAEEAAKTAAVELPKATKRDAKLEKAVAAAYERDYPGNKILKVILGNWSDEYEKDVFGRVTGRDLDATVVNKHPDGKCELHGEYWLQHGNGRSFSGPLSARGAGSLNQTEILCSKVEADASAPLVSSSKKKKK